MPVVETCGGILVAGQQPDVHLDDVHVGCFSVTVKVHTGTDAVSPPWWLTVVYGPQDDGDKLLFLEELSAIRDACTGPWAVIGDFNLILNEEDKSNGTINRRNLNRFRQTVSELELVDIHMHGRRYTWSNERRSPTLVRLDRALVSLDWEAMHPDCHLQALSSDASDHCPLLLQTQLCIHHMRRFHFESFWPKMPGYQEAVVRGWTCAASTTDPLRRLDELFRNLKRELQSWAASRIGNIRDQLLMARSIILRLDQAAERRALSDSEHQLRKDLKLKVLGLASLERTMARQRARVRFLADGDTNTKYFHMLARGRKRRNGISRLRNASGDACSSHEQMEAAILDHFRSVFGQDGAGGFTMDFQAIGIPSLDLSALDLPFSEEEVEVAVRDMPSDRAPGPDGFTGLFYKSSWSHIKVDVLAAINAVIFGDSRAFNRLNNALIVLLPKMPDAAVPGDYRPISMIHSFVKLVSKLLASRLAPLLKNLISPNQNAFIRGRTIHDNFKFVQRAAVYLRKNKTPMTLLKLDISKAFDTVAWSFLLDALQAFGFGAHWRRWVTTLLSTATSRIILNGRPGNAIKHRRGVRQGDSLSPMLFIIAMEVFARLVATAAAERLLKPITVPGIRHHCSLYADDVIIFMQPDVAEATVVKEILRIFGEASGLQTNLAKCSITPIHLPDDNLPQLQEVLGCRRADFPITYLGLPLSTKKIPRARIQSTIDGIERRLPSCHGPLMARSSRLIWIKSVLSAIPIYTIIADGLPPWAIDEISSICRRFLWTGKEGSVRGKCMVAWDTVCRPTDLGGLGIPDLRLTSIALQARWLWLQKVDQTRAWSSLPITSSREVRAFFSASTYTVLGDGRNTAFWTGRWIQGQSVKDIAPALLAFVSNRDIKATTVAAGLSARAWVRQISGGISSTAILDYLKLWDAMAQCQLGVGEDSLIWRWTPDGQYSAKSAYRALLLPSHPVHGYSRIWKTWAPLRVKIFL